MKKNYADGLNCRRNFLWKNFFIISCNTTGDNRVLIDESTFVSKKEGGEAVTDAQIIKQLGQKDEEALLHLQNRYGAYCYSIAFSLLREEPLVQECLNDVWLAVWSGREAPRDLKAYLAKITRNTALHYIQKNTAKKRSAAFVLLDELAECVPDPLREREFEARLLRGLLNDFVRGLKAEERYLFLRRYWYGYSISELAHDLGWREAKVTSMLFRLRKKLKNSLEKEGFTG